MPRYQRGENEKIDHINDLVWNIKNGVNYEESFVALLEMFKPLLLKICSKWSKYFNDENHKIKRFDELMADAEYWFMKYTIEKYTIDGEATFNTFIKNHIDQRIRYIYECELKYYKNNIFPDPSKSGEDDNDMYESIVYKYRSNTTQDIESDIIDRDISESRILLANKIVELINLNIFNDRERLIFNEIMCNGTTHEEMGNKLNISRTRVTQILKKIKIKLYRLMESDQEVWDLVIKLDIDFEESK